jgi:diguanylate cyclase (GGDEF)-like protein/PAS domain S-box-containing protein
MSGQTIKVLLIEDNPGDARLLSEMLVDIHTALFELEWVDCLSRGLERLREERLDIVLLDLNLPDGAGLETFYTVRDQAPETPIIILSGMVDEDMAVRTVREGAQDYIVKGNIDGHLLERAIHYAIERKRSEKALEESEKKYRSMFQLSPEVIILLNDKGDVLDVNARIEDWLGYTPDDVAGKNFFQVPFLKEQGRAEVAKKFSLRMRGEQLPPYEVRFVAKDGRIHIGRVVGTPIRDENGRIVRDLVMISDITQQKMVEEALRRSRMKTEGLHEIASLLEACSSEQEAYQITVDAAEKILSFSLCTLDVVEGKKLLVKATSSGLPPGASVESDLDESSIAAQTYKAGKTIRFGNLGEVPQASPTRNDFRSGISAPIGDFGIFQVVSTQENAFDSEDQKLLELLLGHTAEAVQRIRLQSELREQATRDPLTGVFNRRYFREAIDLEVERCRRHGRSIGFLLIDVDRLKQINDTFGHQTGDKVLREVALFLKGQVRASEMVVRYGGDEFLIVLTEHDDGFEGVKRRIVEGLAHWNEKNEAFDFPVWLSVGGARWDPGGDESVEEVLAKADLRMYEDKRARASGVSLT